MKLAVLGVALAVVGCVQSSSLVCGDRVCPSDFICTPDEVCVSEEAVEQCVNMDEGEACTVRGIPGQCAGGYCAGIVCGNGIVDPGEVCDDGNLDPGDGCNPTCRSTEFCGNGFVDPGELCDCGDGAPEHANPACGEANSDAASAACRPDCTPHGCGDGVIENAEQCEPGIPIDPAEFSCATFGFYEGTVTCNSVCRVEPQCTLSCGDGVINGPAGGPMETCDTEPPTETCIDYGFGAGALGCSDLCRPSFDRCRSIGWLQYHEDNRGFLSVWGVSANDVWAGGSSGRLRHWNGTAWTNHSLGANVFVFGLWGSASDNVYAVTGQKIFHYDGTGWSQTATAPGDLTAISGAGNRVIAVGEAGLIYTYDGSTWSTETSGTTFGLSDVHVVSATEAYAVGHDDGNESIMLRWDGSAWSEMPHPPMYYLHTVWGTSGTNLYIGGDALMHWDGTRWSSMATGLAGEVLALHGSGATDFYAVFGGGTSSEHSVAHFDGEAWAFHDAGDMTGANEVWTAPGAVAFVAGERMSRYLGAAWSHARPPRGANFLAVGGPTDGHVLAVGRQGLALRFDGSFWRAIPSELADMVAVSRGIVVGAHGGLATYDGTRLVARNSGTTQPLHAVWAASDTDAWAGGANGTLVHFNGTTGTPITPVTTQTINAMWGTAANNIYAVGSSGLMLHYNGSTWAVLTPTGAPTENLTSLSGTSSTNFYVGSGQSVWRCSPTSCTNMPSPNTFVRGIFALSTTEVFVVGGDSTLRVFNGTNWATHSLPGNAFAVGNRGTEVYAAGTDLSLMRRMSTNADFQEMVPRFAAIDPVSSLYVAGANDAYAIKNAKLLHFDGALWTRALLNLTPQTVHGSGPDNVFVTQYGSSNIAHWNGTTWLYEPAGSSSIRAVHAISSTDAWAVGDAGTIRRYNGSTWSTVTNSDSSTLVGVIAFGPDRAFAIGLVGTDTTVLEWSSGAWSTMTTPPLTGGARRIGGSSASDVYVVGINSLLSHWNGSTWETPSAAQTLTNYWVHAAAVDDVFVTGSGGATQHFDGQRWAPVRSHLTADALAVEAAGSTVFFGYQAAESILRLHRDVAW